jgi:hypothetical protein
LPHTSEDQNTHLWAVMQALQIVTQFEPHGIGHGIEARLVAKGDGGHVALNTEEDVTFRRS